MSISNLTSIALSSAFLMSFLSQTEPCLGQSTRRTASTPDNWVKRLTAIHNEQKKFGKGDKVKDLDKGTATLIWIRATKKHFADNTADLLKPALAVIFKFEPLWKANKLQLDLFNRYADRMQYLPMTEIEKWKQSLAKEAEPPKNGEVLFDLLTIDRLFDAKGLKTAEAALVLKHLEALTDAQINAVAQAVGIDKVRAALEMAQEALRRQWRQRHGLRRREGQTRKGDWR